MLKTGRRFFKSQSVIFTDQNFHRKFSVLLIIVLSILVSNSYGAASFQYNKSIYFRGGKIEVRSDLPFSPFPKIGLVLSGGGSRGMYHIGVLKSFEKNHIPIHLIVGTSVGAVIGGLYASGYTPDQIVTIMKHIDWNDIYRDETQRSALYLGQKSEHDRYLLRIRFNHGNPYIPVSYSPGQKILSILSDLILQAPYQVRNNFDNLKVPFRAVATDLVSGRQVVLDKGNLAEAINASLALPLLFSPVERDSLLLVDGGLRSNLPVSVARDLHMNLIVASDVTSGLRSAKHITAPWEIVDQATTIMSTLSTRMEEKRADILFKPDLKGFMNTDFSKIDTLVAMGERDADRYLGQLKIHLSLSRPKTERHCFVYSVHYSGITIPDSIVKLREVKRGATITAAEINHDLDLFLQNGNLQNIRVTVDSLNEGYGIRFDARSFSRVNAISLKGVTIYSQVEILKGFSTRIGQPLNRFTLERDIRHLIERYRKDGYSLMRIEALGWDQETGLLSVTVDEGYIDRIIIHGNEKTRDFVIRREFSFQKGKVFNWRTVRTAIQNVYATQLFDKVGVEINEEDHQKTLIVAVQEKSSILFQLGGKHDSERGPQAWLEFGDENFLGRDARVMFAARFGNKDGWWGVKIRNDRIFTTYFTFDLQAYLSKEINPYVGYDNLRGRYREERSGIRFSIGQQLRRIGQLAFELRQEHISDQAVEGNFGHKQNIELRTFAIRAVTDRRDRVDFPTKGIFNHWAFESGNRLVLETRESYTKALVNLEGYYTYHRTNTWHLHLFVGLGDRTMPFSENFRLGGLDSFYGLHQNEYFGRQIVLMNAEFRYRLPMYFSEKNFLLKRTYISARYDFGGIWENPALVFSSEDFFSGFGIRLSIETLLGPLHIAYGRTTRGTGVAYFSLGFNY